MRRLKCVIVGDAQVGKSSLFIKYSKNIFPDEYIPTVFEVYIADSLFNGETVEIAMWDTAGYEDYDHLRPLWYPDTDVTIIMFDVVYPSSYENVREKWIPEVKHFLKNKPIVLVGHKIDLRNDDRELEKLRKRKQKPITKEQGLQLAKEIGATAYVEASSKTEIGVKRVFDAVIRADFEYREANRSGFGKYISTLKRNFLQLGEKVQGEENINVPEEIKGLDDVSIETYISALQHGIEQVYDVRLMIVGPFGVGKTTLANRLLKKKVKISKRQSTDGIEIHERKCGINIQTGKWLLNTDIVAESTPLSRIAKIMTDSAIKEKEVTEPISEVENTETNTEKQKIQEEKVMNSDEQEQCDDGEEARKCEIVEEPGRTTDTSRTVSEQTAYSDLENDNGELKSIEESSKTDDEGKMKKTKKSSNTKGKHNLEIDETRRGQVLASINKTIKKLQSPKHKHVKEIGKLSIWDFGGQFLFYSTHQVFLTARAIYIIVIDISKRLTDEVMDECFLDSSGVISSSLQERLLFWLNSIHTYGRNDEEGLPPVFLVATHRDKLKGNKEVKTEKVKRYFEGIRDFLADKKVHVHLVGEDFCIDNTKEDRRLKLLKQKIYEVASKQKYWGEAIPARWIALENSFTQQKDQDRKILSFEDVVTLDKSSDMPINDEKELKLFLQFQHDLGNIVFFNDENLRHHVVLQTQWLVDAFRCLITAKDFCTTSIQMRGEWKEFYEEGILKESLIDFVWKMEENRQFYQNKAHILGLMEKIDIIAKPLVNIDSSSPNEESTEFYLSPCLLRQQFPKEDLVSLTKEATESPSLCYVFTEKFVPPAIFHRLLAACIGNWKIIRKMKKLMLYCCCGLFSTKDPLGRFLVSQKDHIIQIRMFYFGDEVKLQSGICVEVREFITKRLNKIIELFRMNMPYTVCIRCKNALENPFEGLIEVNQLLQSQSITCDSHGKQDSHAVQCNDLLKSWFSDVLKTRKKTTSEAQTTMLDNPEAILYRSVVYNGMAVRSETPSDGDCFFHAVSDQLIRLGMPQRDHITLRNEIVEYLRNLDEAENAPLKGYIGREWNTYLEDMSRPGTYVDHVIVQSMAKLLQRQVTIVTCPTDGDEGDITEHRINETAADAGLPILLGYVHDNYYQSLDVNPKFEGSALASLCLKKKIRKNYKYIVRDTDLQLLVDPFYSEGIFSLNEKELVENAIPNTTDQKNRIFLDIILKKSKDAFELFLEELSGNGRSDIVDLIQTTAVAEIVHEKFPGTVDTKF